MQDIFDSTRKVKVIAKESGSGTRYSIEVNGTEIHHIDDPIPPSANGRIAYYQIARPALDKKLASMGEDARTICQELQISIMMATD